MTLLLIYNIDIQKIMKIYFNLLIPLFLVCLPIVSLAQEVISYEDEYANTGLEGSINIGMFYADKNTANFYNGANTADGMNSADRVINNEYHLNDINATLEKNGYRYPLIKGYYNTEYPAQMTYKISMSAGIGLRYWLTPTWAVSIGAHFGKGQTSDAFLIRNTNPNLPPSNKENQYVQGRIVGEDARSHFDVGIESKHPVSEHIFLLLGGGMSLNNTIVKYNEIQIYDLTLDIKYKGPHEYVPNGTQQQYNFRQGGIGYGAYLSPGLEFVFLDNISVDIVAHTYYSQIQLQNYEKWGFHLMPHIRFNLSRLFF